MSGFDEDEKVFTVHTFKSKDDKAKEQWEQAGEQFSENVTQHLKEGSVHAVYAWTMEDGSVGLCFKGKTKLEIVGLLEYAKLLMATRQ